MHQGIPSLGLLVTMMIVSSYAFAIEDVNKVYVSPDAVDDIDVYNLCREYLDKNKIPGEEEDSRYGFAQSALINVVGNTIVNTLTAVGGSDADSEDIYVSCKNIVNGKFPSNKPFGEDSAVTSPAHTQEGNNPVEQ